MKLFVGHIFSVSGSLSLLGMAYVSLYMNTLEGLSIFHRLTCLETLFSLSTTF